MSLQLATVTITAVSSPGASVVTIMNKDVPSISGGIARWNTVSRPRRRDSLEFDSEDPVKLTFGVMLEAWPDGQVEDACRLVYSWAAKNALPEEPSIVHVTGPVLYPEIDYIITKIDDTGEVQRRSDGVRCRQELKFEFTEYQHIDLVSANTPAAAAAPPPPVTALAVSIAQGSFASGGTYTVVKGDTLSSIAARKLGNANKWHDIATLNNLRDPNRISVGQVLKLP